MSISPYLVTVAPKPTSTGLKRSWPEGTRPSTHTQVQAEERTRARFKEWKDNILPFWEMKRSSERTRLLWRKGIPPNMRQHVWALAVENALKITPSVYKMLTKRRRVLLPTLSASAGEKDPAGNSSLNLIGKEHSLGLVDLDTKRTFASLGIFTRKGVYNERLRSVLEAYACFRPDVGYIQGMSYIAASICISMPDEYLSFQVLSNLLAKGHLFTFYTLNKEYMRKYYALFNDAMRAERSPGGVAQRLDNIQLDPHLYLFSWMQTLFHKVLPLSMATRVIDCFLLDGTQFVFRFALAILRTFRADIERGDFVDIVQLLTASRTYKQRWDRMSEDELFDQAETITLSAHVCRRLDRLSNDVFFFRKSLEKEKSRKRQHPIVKRSSVVLAEDDCNVDPNVRSR